MNCTDFRRAVAADKAFAEKFAACKTPEALVEAAAREGYTFTIEDIRNNTEVSLEELERTTGGFQGDFKLSAFLRHD